MFEIENKGLRYIIRCNGTDVFVKPDYDGMYISRALVDVLRDNLALLGNLHLKTIKSEDKVGELMRYYAKLQWNVKSNQHNLSTNELGNMSVS